MSTTPNDANALPFWPVPRDWRPFGCYGTPSASAGWEKRIDDHTSLRVLYDGERVTMDASGEIKILGGCEGSNQGIRDTVADGHRTFTRHLQRGEALVTACADVERAFWYARHQAAQHLVGDPST